MLAQASPRGDSSSQKAEIRVALFSFVSHTHNNFTSPLFPLIIVFIKRLPDAYLLSGAESGPYTAKCHSGACVCEKEKCRRRKCNGIFHGVLGSESVKSRKWYFFSVRVF